MPPHSQQITHRRVLWTIRETTDCCFLREECEPRVAIQNRKDTHFLFDGQPLIPSKDRMSAWFLDRTLSHCVCTSVCVFCATWHRRCTQKAFSFSCHCPSFSLDIAVTSLLHYIYSNITLFPACSLSTIIPYRALHSSESYLNSRRRHISCIFKCLFNTCNSSDYFLKQSFAKLIKENVQNHWEGYIFKSILFFH